MEIQFVIIGRLTREFLPARQRRAAARCGWRESAVCGGRDWGLGIRRRPGGTRGQ
ncbi:MAG: hypothetical protein MZV64_23490 [Ignavibacteriales bacterium]|nr:hypothetical protein [Ignavibacteriales bacterium]